MDEVSDGESISRIIDVDLPAQFGPDMLDLHSDFPHFAPQFIICELIRRILNHVATAERILCFQYGLEGCFETLANFLRQFLALLAELLMRFFFCRFMNVSAIETG